MFVEEYLVDLRRARFRPAACLEYARRTFRLSRDHALTRPETLRSLGLTALVGCLLLLGLAVAMALRLNVELARRIFLGCGLILLAGLLWIAFHLRLLVDAAARPLRRLNLANLLTLARLVSIPAFVILLGEGRRRAALFAYAAGALTDVADGLIARLARQQTPLGRVFDPVVDILFNLALFGALYRGGYLAGWVLALVLARYGLLLCGGAGLYIFRGPVEIRPTALGKTTGVITTLLVIALTFGALGLPEADYRRISPLLVIGIGFVEAITIPMVVLIGWLNFRRHRRPAGTPQLTLVAGERRLG